MHIHIHMYVHMQFSFKSEIQHFMSGLAVPHLFCIRFQKKASMQSKSSKQQAFKLLGEKKYI